MYYYCTRNVPSRVKKNSEGQEFMITKFSLHLCLALRGLKPLIALSKE